MHGTGDDKRDRRWFLRCGGYGLAAGSAAAAGSTGWTERLASLFAATGSGQATGKSGRARSCIVLWMNGGASQTDTFDPKPAGRIGMFDTIATATPGIAFSALLPLMALWTPRMAIIRGMSTKEGDHVRGTRLLRTGYAPDPVIAYPPLGSLVAKEKDGGPGVNPDIPGYVSIAPAFFFQPQALRPGFLDPKFAALAIGEQSYGGTGANGESALTVRNLAPVNAALNDAGLRERREALRAAAAADFLAARRQPIVQGNQAGYEAATRLMAPKAARAFRLEEESDALRDEYGRNSFGQGCLLARRLVERGVPFIEVSHNGNVQGLGWDTHNESRTATEMLCATLDQGWSALMKDLQSRGLLEETLIVWMSEFGRTPQINRSAGRDHYPNAWTAVLAGGGIRGGQVIGDTGADGLNVRDRPVTAPDLLATVCKNLNIDSSRQNLSDIGRPIRIVSPEAVPVKELIP